MKELLKSYRLRIDELLMFEVIIGISTAALLTNEIIGLREVIGAIIIISAAIIDIVNPKKAYLTHISHYMGTYDDVSQELPNNVFLAYDNLELNI